ncbi:MAG: TSUP family transporter, partial [Hyphomicrobiaceae bacterium]
ILVALHVVQSALVVPKVWRRVPPSLFLSLGAGALIGMPLGLAVFLTIGLRELKLGAGLLILAASALIAWRRWRTLRMGTPSPLPQAPKAEQRSAAITGLVSGALTALLVMPGPPLMVHLLRYPLAGDTARSLSLTFFAACYLAVLAAHGVAGSLGASDWATVAWLAPFVVLGTLGGIRSARHLGDRHLAMILNVLLVLSGVGAIVSAL